MPDSLASPLPETAAPALWSAAMPLLLQRRSVPPRLLSDPAPEGEALDTMLAAAMRAPDHGIMVPWRFILIRDEARSRLGEVFAAARAARDPDVSAGELDRERAKPLRAPLIVALGIAVNETHPKVRAMDQVLSGAAAAQNLLLAAQALGFGGMWLTGETCYDPAVKSALGLAPKDAIVGYLYIGTPGGPILPKPRPDPRPVTTEWREPAAAKVTDAP